MLKPRSDLVYGSTKTYTHSIGLSCCFRQWKAQSHCRLLHGYALQVKLTFETEELDTYNWVVDFGSLKSLKGWLEDTFDHKLLVAEDDPMKEVLMTLGYPPAVHTYEESVSKRVADIRVLQALGMEQFARMIYEYSEGWLVDNGYSPRCVLQQVEVSEHPANSAFVRRKEEHSSNEVHHHLQLGHRVSQVGQIEEITGGTIL